MKSTDLQLMNTSSDKSFVGQQEKMRSPDDENQRSKNLLVIL